MKKTHLSPQFPEGFQHMVGLPWRCLPAAAAKRLAALTPSNTDHRPALTSWAVSLP